MDSTEKSRWSHKKNVNAGLRTSVRALTMTETAQTLTEVLVVWEGDKDEPSASSSSE